ncbi:bifunctional enoyl-CoA hydratase/phosphate acetyltransferase [Cetobacterium somerae]|uniref:bifunctional enoyl-CoA hydratase/phosphate acetyltransferase n=1 Tax=Cetobacterium somerae TaxID=188913 RepID=UPI003D769A38
MKNFEELLEQAKLKGMKKISVACADEAHVLISVEEARKKGLIEAILVGNKENIISVAESLDIDISKYEIIDERDSVEACNKAVNCIVEGKAQILMKGLVDSSVILRAALKGLRKKDEIHSFLSHVAIFEVSGFDRIIFLSDAGMNISPNVEEKALIIKNTVFAAKRLGIENPKVAVLAAKEKVDEKMPVTVIAAELEKMNKDGLISDCIVQGPLALDNAISMDSVKIKGVKGEVAGKADILITPNLEAGNILYKSLSFFARAQSAGNIVGAIAPIVLPSRADTADAKFYSIVLSILLS